jgi:hypothetical protein
MANLTAVLIGLIGLACYVVGTGMDDHFIESHYRIPDDALSPRRHGKRER